MPLASLLAIFSVSKFDGRKLLVVMTVLAITLTVESQIGYIADFIPEQLASQPGNGGIHNYLGNIHDYAVLYFGFS